MDGAISWFPVLVDGRDYSVPGAILALLVVESIPIGPMLKFPRVLLDRSSNVGSAATPSRSVWLPDLLLLGSVLSPITFRSVMKPLKKHCVSTVSVLTPAK